MSWDGVSHKHTRYCVIESTLSTTCCQNFFENCSPIVYIEPVCPVFDFFFTYVVHRFFTYWCQKHTKKPTQTQCRKGIWPCHVFWYIWYFSSWAHFLPIRSAKVREKNDRCHRTRPSSFLWKMTRSNPWWDESPQKCPKRILWCKSHPRWWVWYICADTSMTAWYIGILIWSESSRGADSRAFSSYSDCSYRRIWDRYMEE